MAAAAAPLSLAATGLSAFGKLDAAGTAAGNAITQGYSTQAADQYRAQTLSNDAAYGDLAATQTATDMDMQLNGKLAGIEAVRASANVDPNSPTGYALFNRTEAVGDMNRQQRVANIEAQAGQDRTAAGMYAQAGAAALQQGYANASNDQASGFLSAISSGLSGLSGLKLFSGG